MTARTLRLRRERLAELTEEDLGKVAGGDISLLACLADTLQATRCFCP